LELLLHLLPSKQLEHTMKKHLEIFKICLILIIICLPISYGAYFGYINHINTKATAMEVKAKVIDKSSTNGTSNVYVYYNNKQYIFQVGGTRYTNIRVGDSISFLYSVRVNARKKNVLV